MQVASLTRSHLVDEIVFSAEMPSNVTRQSSYTHISNDTRAVRGELARNRRRAKVVDQRAYRRRAHYSSCGASSVAYGFLEEDNPANGLPFASLVRLLGSHLSRKRNANNIHETRESQVHQMRVRKQAKLHSYSHVLPFVPAIALCFAEPFPLASPFFSAKPSRPLHLRSPSLNLSEKPLSKTNLRRPLMF